MNVAEESFKEFASKSSESYDFSTFTYVYAKNLSGSSVSMTSTDLGINRNHLIRYTTFSPYNIALNIIAWLQLYNKICTGFRNNLAV